jgi:glycosyltransferase involved in cell wall biosynthesis
MSAPQYLADFSLALINRTGAYYVCRDVVERLGHFFPAVRYWRLFLKQEPHGLMRRMLGRAMLYELGTLSAEARLPRPRESGAGDLPTLFLDPLYVLRASLEPRDIVLCHDVGPLSHPELFEIATVTMYERAYDIIRRARPGMVFVSEASRASFASMFGEDFRFVKVIPLYVRQALNDDGAAKPPHEIRKPFLLTVGATEARKNHLKIIEAFTASGLRERGYSCVFCGPRGNSAEAVQALADVTEGVHGFGYVSDAELRWLYGNAAGFVLPSLLEGFGLPPLEAAQHGLVSVVSREGAQKEAVGQGAILVDPLSVPDIAEGMRRLVDMPEPERQRRLGLARGHADYLSQERYLQRWSDLLSQGTG